MNLEVWCRTDRGLKREINQDSFLINENLGLYIVADGMGGHKGGEVASSIAVKTVEDVVQNPPMADLKPRDLLSYAYTEASRRIFDMATNEDPELAGMGTTMVLLFHDSNKIYLGNVGDSRGYLFRRPHLWQLTEDHSLVMDQLRAGMINEQQVQNFAGRNVITRSVGYEREVSADFIHRPLTRGDVFILCSDGLTSMVPDNKIAEILNKTSTENFVDHCIEAALKNGGDDNVTVMVIEVS
jgi:PPM family protein phosphatase